MWRYKFIPKCDMIPVGNIVGPSRGLSLSPCKILSIKYIPSADNPYPPFCKRKYIPIYSTMLGEFNPSYFPKIGCIHCCYYGD